MVADRLLPALRTVILLAGMLASGLLTSYALFANRAATLPAPAVAPAPEPSLAPAVLARAPDIPPVQP